MSFTVLLWMALFAGLALLTLYRPAWGIVLYLFTFYAEPHFWWWGKWLTGTFGDRINLAAALIFALGVFLHRSTSAFQMPREHRWVLGLIMLYAINATLVHFLFANDPARSLRGMTMIWKQLGLLFLVVAAIRTQYDIRLFVTAITFGSLYIAYEIIFNDRGHISAGRLEGVGAPGAAEANYLAGLMCFMVPPAGHWLFFGKRWQKLLAAGSLILVFEVILRCNSRGAFLALIAGGIWLVFAARGRARRYALTGMVLGSLAAVVMIGDQRIIDRFLTVFASESERDTSAQSRLDFWKTAVRLIAANPQGSGAEAAFKSALGRRFLKNYLDLDETRAVHNGYLDIAASWGVQGLTLYLVTIGFAWRMVRRAGRRARESGDDSAAFLGVCLESTLVVQLTVCLFISSLDGEWFFWWFALALGFDRVFRAAPNSTRLPASVRPVWTRYGNPRESFGVAVTQQQQI